MLEYIHCDECQKYLFKTERKSEGAIGAEAHDLGFVFKMPALFTSEYRSLYFCDKDCAKLFYDKHIPKNPEASKALEDFRNRIPEMSKDIAAKMQKLVKGLNK